MCCVNCLEKISIEDFELAAEELKQSRARLDDFIGSKSADDLLGDIFCEFLYWEMMGVSCWDFGIKNNMHSLYIHMPQKSKKAYPCLSHNRDLCAGQLTGDTNRKTLLNKNN